MMNVAQMVNRCELYPIHSAYRYAKTEVTGVLLKAVKSMQVYDDSAPLEHLFHGSGRCDKIALRYEGCLHGGTRV